MNKITLRFSGNSTFNFGMAPVIELTLDESGNHVSLENSEDVPTPPSSIMDAFTETAIDEILLKDEIPETDVMVLDGNMYSIDITKGDILKSYSANDSNIDVYPLLGMIAEWYSENCIDMEDELTTAMHAELMEGEATEQEMKYLGICGAMNRGLSKAEALKKYGVSEEEYDTKGKAFLSS